MDLNEQVCIHTISSSPIVRSVVTGVVSRVKRCKACTHRSADEFFAGAASATPSLLLLDYLLGGKPAGHVLSAMAEDPALRDLPVWILHGPPSSEPARADQDDFPQVQQLIAKPFRLGAFSKQLRQFAEQAIVQPRPVSHPALSAPSGPDAFRTSSPKAMLPEKAPVAAEPKAAFPSAASPPESGTPEMRLAPEAHPASYPVPKLETPALVTTTTRPAIEAASPALPMGSPTPTSPDQPPPNTGSLPSSDSESFSGDTLTPAVAPPNRRTLPTYPGAIGSFELDSTGAAVSTSDLSMKEASRALAFALEFGNEALASIGFGPLTELHCFGPSRCAVIVPRDGLAASGVITPSATETSAVAAHLRTVPDRK